MPEDKTEAKPEATAIPIAKPRADEIDLESEMKRLNIQPLEGEKVYQVIPKQIGEIFSSLAMVSLFILLSLVGLVVYIIFFAPSTTAFVTTAIVLGAIYLTVVLYGISEWYSHTFSALIVTDERIIHSQQLNLFSRHLQEIDIHAVQNVRGNYYRGVGQLFSFGAVTIDRIGMEPITVKYLNEPEVIAQEIMHYHILVAHGGVETAHNFQASSIADDKTPELENILKTAEKVAETQEEPNVATPGAQRSINLPKEKKEALPQPPGKKPEPEAKQEPKPEPKPESQPETEAVAQQITAKPVDLLHLQVPSEKIGEVTQQLAEKDPSINYSPKADAFEVEAIVPKQETPVVVKELKKKGARKIIKEPAEMIE